MVRNKLVKALYLVCLVSLSPVILSQTGPDIHRVEPPNWWTQMPSGEIQLLVNGANLGEAKVSGKSGDLEILKVHHPENSNYLFIDVKISEQAKAGEFPIEVKTPEGKTQFSYPLKERESDTNRHQGFDAADAIYLLMPDRFSNANPENDNMPGMLEEADRNNTDGRHGGDIEGISNHLNYIEDMGFTTLWVNPLLENNMPAYSYHGYAITDFYKVDPRYGDNEAYRELVEAAHNRGLKVVMDMVFNHCATRHWFIEDLPMPDWINQWDTLTKSNFRGEVKADPYASEADIKRMEDGWFDVTMADLNQRNPFVLKYLTQNSIWWIEYAGIDAIRMDTYPYPDKEAMAEWAKTINTFYPEFTILGETWLQRPAHTAYWQQNKTNKDGYQSHVPVVTDFPLHYAIVEAMNEEEGWTQGLNRLYYILSQDLLYKDPSNLVTFLDNHDLNRFYTSIGEDLSKFKLAVAFLLTTNRIPQIYYGTEFLMTGEEHKGHGYIREDFPGGWTGDSVNAFTGEGLSHAQTEAQQYVKTVLNWRKNAPAVSEGELLHFIPEDSIYVYFRLHDKQRIMVIINKNDELKTLPLGRFAEGMGNATYAKDVVTGKKIRIGDTLSLEPLTPLILELSENE